MTQRTVEKVFRNNEAHWVGNGFHVKQYLPGPSGEKMMRRFSPFIMLDYNAPYFFQGTPFETGVGPHPHKGFETVTISFAGKVAHGDSQGNYGVIDSGDVQWMTAAGGVLHKEFHEKEYAKKDRLFHMVQLWVNLPAKHKFDKPSYQAIKANQMGKYVSLDESVKGTVYAGHLRHVQGPARTHTPINLYRLEINKGHAFTLEEPKNFNLGFLVVEGGSGTVNGDVTFENGDFVLFNNDGESVVVEAVSDNITILVLSGEPIDEPVAAYGPFVMNTFDEIIEAQQEFQSGKYGTLDF